MRSSFAELKLLGLVRSGRYLRSLCALALSVECLTGCGAPPHIVSLPYSPAVADSGEKAAGLTRARFMGEQGPRSGDLVLSPMAGTFAQSAEGPRGDTVFRLDPHGLLEGCRYLPNARVCSLVTLPEGTILGGALSWIAPSDAPATPRAGGWVVQGPVFSAQTTTLADFTIGRVFYCRFDDSGPRCLAAPATKIPIAFAPLASFSLMSGGERHDVIWIGDIAVAQAGGAEPTLGDVHRCEVTEDAEEVTCQFATMK